VVAFQSSEYTCDKTVVVMDKASDLLLAVFITKF